MAGIRLCGRKSYLTICGIGGIGFASRHMWDWWDWVRIPPYVGLVGLDSHPTICEIGGIGFASRP